jgi:hypothetical protein
MRIPDENRLEHDFQQLCERLRDPDVLNPVHSAPVFYFVFPPRQILTVRRLLPGWIAQLKNDYGLKVEKISVAEILWELIDESGRWEEWLESEEDFEVDEVNESVRSVLRNNNAMIKRVTEEATAFGENTIVFVMDVDLLHPYFRTRPIENYMMSHVKSPVVFFYPGRRAGQYGLHFLEFYPVDPGYRSTIIGGLA